MVSGERIQLWTLLVVLFSTLAASQSTVCVLPTQIIEGSKASVSGNVVEPVAAPILTVTKGSLQGYIYIVFPSAKCPTAAELPAALKSAFIANPAQRPGLATKPSKLVAKISDPYVGDLADVSISGFQVALSSPAGSNAFGANSLAALGTAGTTVVDGYVLPQALTFNMSGANLVFTGCTVGAKGSSVVVDCPQLEAVYKLRLQGVNANIICSGSATASGELGQALLLPVDQIPGAAARLAIAAPAPVAKPTAAGLTAACVLTVAIESAASVVRLVGEVVTPIPAPVTSGPPAALAGALHIMFASATCPTAAQLPTALKTAFLVQPAGMAGGTLTPPSLKGTVVDSAVGKLADLELADFKCDTNSSAIPSNGSLSYICIGTAGTANTKSSILERPVSIPQKGKLFYISNCTVAAAGAGVSISCPRIVVKTTIEDKKTGILARLGLSGSMKGFGALASAKPIKVSSIPGAAKLLAGIAAPPPRTSTPTPATPATPPPTPAARSPVPTLSAAPGDYSTLRNGGQDRCAANTIQPNGNCACQSGWYGRSCAACASDGVCRQLTGSLGSTCSNNLAYTDMTVYKAYNCTLLGGLSALVSQITAVCNVRGSWLPFEGGVLGMGPGGLINGTQPADNRYCKLVVDQVNEPENPLVCTATGCGFKNGLPDFTCASTTCTCPATGKCSDIITAVTRNLLTTPLQLACDLNGRCTVKGTNPQLVAQCSAGECTWPNTTARPLPGAASVAPVPFPIAAVVSAVPSMLLVLLALLGGGYVLAQRSYFATSGPLPAAAAQRKAARQGAPLTGSGLIMQPSYDPRIMAFKDTAVLDIVDDGAASGDRGSGADRAGSVGIGAAAGATSLRRTRLPNEKLGLPLVFSFDSVYCAVPDTTKEGRGAARAATGADGAASGSSVDELPVSVAVVSAAAASPAAAAAGGNPVLQNAYDAAGRRVLLHSVSGSAREGQVMGVMGPSGSGKTTLLSILSGSMESIARDSTVQGTISLGGENKAALRRKVTAYVPQKDVLLPSLTVQESIKYSALLRLPKDLSAQDIQARVNGVLAELGLTRTARSLVGGAGGIRGVSGGERRRVTIGMELVTAPKLVIMDEPTSGLDSYTAYNLMRTAHDIAAAGRVVLMSLHQPSPDMFGALDTILLLARGRLVYSGAPSGVLPHFAVAGVPCPRNRPAAEHMMAAVSEPETLAALLRASSLLPQPSLHPWEPDHADVAGFSWVTHRDQGSLVTQGSVGPGPIAESQEVAHDDDMPSSFAVAMSPASASSSSILEPVGPLPGTPTHAAVTGPMVAGAAGASEGVRPGNMERLRYASRSKAREFAVLFWRTFANMRRSPGMLLLHICVGLATGLVVGLVFFQLDATNVGVQNRLGSMFFALALFGFTSLTMVDSLVLERELVAREASGHYYGTAAYLTAKLVLDGLLLRVLPAVLFTALMYPMVGLMPEPTRVATFIFVLATYACTVGALSVAMSALCRTAAATTLVMNIILLGWVLVGGFLVNPTYMPKWISWVRYLSPMSFAFEALASNEMSDQFYDIVLAGFPQLGAIKGDSVLLTLGLDPYHTLRNVGCLVAFYFGCVLLAGVLYAASMVRGGPLRALASTVTCCRLPGRRRDGSKGENSEKLS